MPSGDHHLTDPERCQIYALQKSGYSIQPLRRNWDGVMRLFRVNYGATVVIGGIVTSRGVPSAALAVNSPHRSIACQPLRKLMTKSSFNNNRLIIRHRERRVPASRRISYKTKVKKQSPK